MDSSQCSVPQTAYPTMQIVRSPPAARSSKRSAAIAVCCASASASGTVVAGTIGGGGRVDFTVIGDAMNTAARVESATRDTGDDLLITHATRSRIDDDDDWIERPAVQLKGKSQPVRIYALHTARADLERI